MPDEPAAPEDTVDTTGGVATCGRGDAVGVGVRVGVIVGARVGTVVAVARVVPATVPTAAPVVSAGGSNAPATGDGVPFPGRTGGGVGAAIGGT
ncbi:MAG: hypothetical protein M3442_16055, partial [Chloroflexota bacterium]|nr:hypothetical protein [Chloroflexota bacterium]